ncbi:Predicted O-linked N-acetylglucosamine transferase, SPINDLY family [Methylobacillus rhizosphaerae]|uniref:protein O-GlcNAc transferase n=1 Tax=Methylobacillus rhizosphaerae TaxID=551994 RepID=A0A238YN74_9PROT|nr:tetratricopeptide repeat protein [Methylobacillus rhizosphaerae]SNR72084.1 Predicted O-linked N-acetylglucosamine transferase, SPINDLY family [Methylobacillus rhizosphaerae]
MNPDQLFHSALEAHRQGQLPQAERLYRQLLAAMPQHAHGQHYLGVLCHQCERYQEAIEHISAAIRLLPGNPDQHNNLGLALRASGQLEAAIHQFQQGLKLAPDDNDLRQNLAATQLAADQPEAALLTYREALRCAPQDADIRTGLHHALQALGNHAQKSGNFPQAAQCFQELMQLEPGNAAWHYNLGNAWREQGQAMQAAACYRQALILAPADADIHNNLGNVLRELQQLPEAIACYERALELNPELFHARVHLLHQRQHACDWRTLDEDIHEIRRWVREFPDAQVSPFAFLAMPGTTPQEQLQCAKQWTQSRHGKLLGSPPLSSRTTRNKDKLHIGYLSCDFRLHPLASLVTEMLERHNRDNFSISAYSYGIDDGTPARRRLMQAVDNFVDIRPLSIQQAAQRIHADHVDILIDLTGYTQASRSAILALRPASIQASWLGFPGTMGATFVDYLISDAILTPATAQADYAEKLALLPHAYQPNDTQRPVADTPSRAACGLPEQGFVYCCFNQSFKITPEVFACWMRLLHHQPGSVLWLLESNTTASANLRQTATSHGIDPGRLIFAPRIPLDQHLARHAHADLFLDTQPYNAHTTASDALWMGVPLLTCQGTSFASRVAASLLHAAGLPELITSSLADYEALARKLASSPALLQQYRQHLLAARTSSPLFDTPGFTRDLETLYRTWWQAHCNT